MQLSKFSNLRDIAQGNFAIRDGCLFYENRQVSSFGTILLASSESVFFLFAITEDETRQKFQNVIFSNYYKCRFYPCCEYKKSGEKLSFSCPDGAKYAFTRYCYNENVRSSIIIGGRICD